MMHDITKHEAGYVINSSIHHWRKFYVTKQRTVVLQESERLPKYYQKRMELHFHIHEALTNTNNYKLRFLGNAGRYRSVKYYAKMRGLFN